MTPALIQKFVQDDLRYSTWVLVATLVVVNESLDDLLRCTGGKAVSI